MSAFFGRGAALVLSIGAAVSAQASWQMEGVGASVAVRSAGAPVVLAAKQVLELPAGTCSVHFPFVAFGKPTSLDLEVADGDRVVVAAQGGGPAVVREVSLADARERRDTAIGQEAKDGTRWRSVDLGGGDQRVELTVGDVDGIDEVGIVARWSPDAGSYRCLWSPGRRTLRLVRVMGGDALELRRTEVPAASAGAHRIALQADGFRLQVWLDDAPVLQLLDGAIGSGEFGVCWTGAQMPSLGAFTVAEPVGPLPSAAIVQSTDAATLHVASTAQPGSPYVLELVLDRPHALLPRTPQGFEPWLLQRSAAPLVLTGDWRGTIGPATVGELPFDGRLAVRFGWPSLPALRHHSALVHLRLALPSGEGDAGTTPAAHVVF